MQTQKNQFSDFIDLELISQRWNQISEETTTKDEQPKFPDELTKISQTSSSFQNKASSIEFKEQESKWEEIKPMLLTKPIIQKEIEKKTRNPFPQIIDEDTENFRIKLDHLINVFKNDALGEFMTMKKFLLENQVKTIKNETEKYLNMYEEKHIQLEKTNATLAEKVQENEQLNKRCLALSSLCGKNKMKWRNNKVLSAYFKKLLNLKKRKFMKKKLNAIAQKNYHKRVLVSSLSNWKTNLLTLKLVKQKNDLQAKFGEDTNELMMKFNKENDMLSKKLQETQKTLDEINISKEEMQENLKRAFMRGVCALNFEAMNILQEKKKTNEDDLIQQTNGLTRKMLDINENMNSLLINPLEEKEERLEEQNNESEPEEIVQNSKKIVFYQAPQMESKDHKWREAPVVGIDNFSKKSADESLDKKFNYGNLPSQELQKNNENFDLKRNLQEFPQKTITNELYDKKNNFGTHKYIENQDFNKIQKENIYENNVLKEIENMPYKLKSNVYNQDAEKEQGKVIIANVPNKRKTELKKKGEENENMTKKKSISGSNNIRKGKI